MSKEGVLSNDKLDVDSVYGSNRPERLADFHGQHKITDNLNVFIQSAVRRQDALDHVLFHGPPGLGKTTLANIISCEMGVGFKSTTGPLISKIGDLIAILTNLEKHDVLFIDEIHRMPSSVEEVLYSAMEDFHVDIIIGDGPAARSIKVDLSKFTLVGATTRIGLLAKPLLDRFGIPLKFSFYNYEELSHIIFRLATKLSIKISQEAVQEISKRSRGTPRIALRLFRRIHDFAIVYNKAMDKNLVQSSLKKLGVDGYGLDESDRAYLEILLNNRNMPVGIEAIAASLSDKSDNIEETIEPYLMQIGFIMRTPRGRVLTNKAVDYLKTNSHGGVESKS